MQAALLLCLSLAPAQVADGAPDRPPFPWKLDRPYEYTWRLDGEPAGSLTLVFRRRKDADGEWLVLRTERRLRHGGKSLHSTGELHFDEKDGRPILYRDEAEASQANGSGRQTTRIRFEKDRAESKIIPNSNAERAVEKTIPIKSDTLLFGTGALDHWTLFASRLRGREKVKIPVLYPEFARVIEIEFTPKGEDEEIRVGDRTVRARKFEFRYRDFADRGEIWLDEEGRLIRYQSGPTLLELNAL